MADRPPREAIEAAVMVLRGAKEAAESAIAFWMPTEDERAALTTRAARLEAVAAWLEGLRDG